MSGPKVDIARLRRQEKELLAAARKRRMLLADKIDKYINEVENCINPDIFSLKDDKNIVISCDKIRNYQVKSLKKLNDLLKKVKDGDELLNVEDITRECEVIYDDFNNDVKDELKLINQLVSASEEYKAKQENRQAIANSKRKIISRISSVQSNIKDISVDNPSENLTNNKMEQDNIYNVEVTQDIVRQQYETFDQEICEYMEQENLTVKHKKSMLQIRQDLVEIFNSNIDLEKKSMRISRLFDEYEKMDMMISREIEDMKLVYDEYLSECFDLKEEPKKLSDFSSKKEIELEIEIAKKVAEKRMTKLYIKRQIDEVMSKHGYDIVQSDVLEQANNDGQVILLFVTFRVATFLKIFNPTLCPNRQISHCY